MEERKFNYGIKGHVKVGFEPVVNYLEKLGKEGYDKTAQLCVYVGQECVIDVIMSADKDFTADHKTRIYSSGKSVASIMLAKVVDQGLIAYEDEVAKHWPEFAQNGKDKMKVEDVMRHEAGFTNWPVDNTPYKDAFTEGIK
jgi:CubicO group peptidase (beta-lactamase class C family)